MMAIGPMAQEIIQAISDTVGGSVYGEYDNEAGTFTIHVDQPGQPRLTILESAENYRGMKMAEAAEALALKVMEEMEKRRGAAQAPALPRPERNIAPGRVPIPNGARGSFDDAITAVVAGAKRFVAEFNVEPVTAFQASMQLWASTQG